MEVMLVRFGMNNAYLVPGVYNWRVVLCYVYSKNMENAAFEEVKVHSLWAMWTN